MLIVDKIYKYVAKSSNFNINAGININPNMKLSELYSFAKRNIKEGKKSCCFHYSVFLSGLLHGVDVYTEIIITKEPVYNKNGYIIRNDMRASVLYYDSENRKYYVANPVEDAEFLKNLKKEEKELCYIDGTTELSLDKSSIISSKDACHIDLKDFIERYGNGVCYSLGNIFKKESSEITLDEALKNSTIIDINKNNKKKTKKK